MSVKIGATYTITNKYSGTVADYNQSDLRVSINGYSFHGYSNQQWIIEDAGYGFYYIKSGKGGYVSFDGVASSGSPLICSVTKQRFRIIQDSLDSSLIKVLHPTLDLSMDIAGGSSALGTKILLYTTHTGRNQAWNFKLIAEPRKPFDPNFAPAFFLENLRTKTIADVSTRDNKSVTGCAKAKTPNQVFFTEQVDQAKSLYYIRSATGSYLSIAGSTPGHTPIIASSTKQVWEFRADASDPQLVRIYYPDSDYLFDLTASNPAQGTPIILYPTQNPGVNQQWKVVPAQ